MERNFCFFSRRIFIMGLFSGMLRLFGQPKEVLASSNSMDLSCSFTEEEWKERLSLEAFNVLRKEGTERPFSSELNQEKSEGIFHCAGCDLPLFSSAKKFDSGTGWPSFWQPLENAIDTKIDFKLIVPRTEYHCKKCGGHQGHVFDDGPRPTGKRYCNNGVALNFRASI